MDLYFVSNNVYKIKEVTEFLSKSIDIGSHKMSLEEIQSESLEAIVRHKALDAYKRLRRPVLVEQTGLYISDFGNLPGGLTQIFWDNLQEEMFCEYFGGKKAQAVTMVGFCDGKTIQTYSGSTTGKIVPPRGVSKFQWDRVFQPEDCNHTFAEMGNEKAKNSMRIAALEEFIKHCVRERHE